jgi:hypothetical protein
LKTKSGKVIIPLLLAILALQFTFASKYLFARQSKNIILVLDTSMSMIGQAGGRNIFDKVKKSIIEYIDKNVQDGDRFVFATFETDVKLYPPVVVDDDNDRDILKKYISMSEATGLWTNTYKMIYKVFEEADKLEKEKEGRKTDIVIMTDAIDDPPPGAMKKFNLADFAQKFGKKADVWVYILSFTNVENSEAVKKLGLHLAQITDKVKVIEATEPQKGKEALVEEQKKREPLSAGSILIPLIIAIGCILLLLAIIFIIRKITELKVSGRLEYWNNELIEPYIQHYDLARRPAKEALIGKGLGCTPNIRDINIKTPVTIKAIKHEGAVRMKIIDSPGAAVEMVNGEPGNLLRDGDIFKVGNYTFKYFTSSSS